MEVFHVKIQMLFKRKICYTKNMWIAEVHQGAVRGDDGWILQGHQLPARCAAAAGDPRIATHDRDSRAAQRGHHRRGDQQPG